MGVYLVLKYMDGTGQKDGWTKEGIAQHKDDRARGPATCRPGHRRGGATRALRGRARADSQRRGELANGGYGPGNGSGNGPAEPEQPPEPPPFPPPLPDYPPPRMGDLRPLAKDELANLVPVTKTIVAAFERAAFFEDKSGAPDKKNFDPAKWNRFQNWLKVLVDLCGRVAEYESPKYKPIEVTSGQAAVDEAERRRENEVTVVIRGGLPEPDMPFELDSEEALAKEMEALQAKIDEVRARRASNGEEPHEP